MSIDKLEFQHEKEKLEDTKHWIVAQKHVIEKDNKVLEEKIAALKKQARGRYNEELETTQKLQTVTSKNLQKYSEAGVEPYFARIDFREYRRDMESFYIGKFGLGDSTTGDEVVIDWRAPLSDLYYSGTEGDTYYTAPSGVINGKLSLKRRFLIRSEELKDAFDEGINEIILKSSKEAEGNALIDEFLRINLEESISGKLKDVVATIQKEQNDIIRAEKNNALIVQGSAGSGKTTIALHRLAYLIYKYKNSLSGKDILVVAPNKLFLDYISDLLPNLGVDEVKQNTFEEIALQVLELSGKVYTKDKKLSQILEENDSEKVKYVIGSSKLKGSMAFKTIIDRFIRHMEIDDINVQDIKVEDYVLFDVKEVKRLYSKDMIRFPLNKRKDEIKRYFGLKLPQKISGVLDKIDFTYEYLIAKVKKSMDDCTERRKKLTELYDERDSKKKYIQKRALECFESYFEEWKHGDIIHMYFNLFSDDSTFDEVTDNKIPQKLAEYIKSEIIENKKNGVIDSDDLAAIMYLKFKVDDVPDKYKFKHIVVDEAQDYSLFQLLVLKIMASNNSVTYVGDVGQGIYYYKGIDSWEKVINNLFQGDGNYCALTQSYRSTVEIINFANKVLEKQENALEPAKPVIRHGKAPEIISFENTKEFAERLDVIVCRVKENGKKSVAVIGKTIEECNKIKAILKKYSSYKWELVKDTDKRLKLENIIIPSYMTKGLEFDCSVIYNCNEENYSDLQLDKKILYVVLTRALHEEYIFYNGRLTNLIS